MEKAKPIGPEEIVYKGRIFEIVEQPMQIGEKRMRFEKSRRSPGTRILITKDNKILLNKEWRTELDGYDYRLPGGKVFDTLDELNEALTEKKDLVDAARGAAEREAKEEVGVVIKNAKHIHTTAPGATVSWDLYYFLVEDFEEHADGQQLESGEVIHPEWKTFEEVKEMCLNKEIKEDKTVAVLLRFLLQN